MNEGKCSGRNSHFYRNACKIPSVFVSSDSSCDVKKNCGDRTNETISSTSFFCVVTYGFLRLQGVLPFHMLFAIHEVIQNKLITTAALNEHFSS